MQQLTFGTVKFINFENDSEFFKTLGLLASQSHTRIKIEQNDLQGAWGREGRILCYSNTDNFPLALSTRFSAGVGNIEYRINCNEFVLHLIHEYNFNKESSGTSGVINISPPEIELLRSKVPDQYMGSFDAGFTL